jgi:hypothetical protein
LKLLEEQGFGVIDESLFFQKLTLDRKGMYIADIGDPIIKGQRRTYGFELFSRGNNDTDGYKMLSEVLDFLRDSYSDICELPAVPSLTDGYSNVTVVPTSGITNVGLDDNNRIIYSIQGKIII